MSNKYVIEITETLQKYVHIEAESVTEAIAKVKKKYRNEEIVLGADDYVMTEFGYLGEEE